MRYALTFGALGIVCAAYAATTPSWLVRILLFCFAVAWCGVSLAYAGLGPRTFLKRPDGHLHFLSYLLFWPYFAFNVLSLWFYRQQRGGHLWDEIVPRLYLGGVLTRRQAQAARDLGVVSVLDVTSEWGVTLGWANTTYKTIPVLDTLAPTIPQLVEGAQWLQEATQRGPVYVHCALGHGRSVTFVAAYLLLSGQTTSVEAALTLLKTQRPAVTISRPQMRVLRAFETGLRDGEEAHNSTAPEGNHSQ